VCSRGRRDGWRRAPDSAQPKTRSAEAIAARELLFEFHVERTHRFYRVELRDHGDFGVEAAGCFDLVSRPSALNRGYKR